MFGFHGIVSGLQVVKLPSMKKAKRKGGTSSVGGASSAASAKYKEAHDEPPSYDMACSTPCVPDMTSQSAHQQHQHHQQQMALHTMDERLHMPVLTSSAGAPQSCRFGDVMPRDMQHTLTPGSSCADTNRTSTGSSGNSTDTELNHIKVESLSPENMFESIDHERHQQGGSEEAAALAAVAAAGDVQRAHVAPSMDCRRLASQSSPTSGYNTMGSSPGVSSSSPFSSSGYSPLSQGGYPTSCSPNIEGQQHSIASPTNRSHHPLSPTHYQAVIQQQQQQQHKHRLQQQAQSVHNADSYAAYPSVHHFPTPPLQQQQQQQQQHGHPLSHTAGVHADVLTHHMPMDSRPTVFLTPSPESPGHWSSSSNEGVYL